MVGKFMSHAIILNIMLRAAFARGSDATANDGEIKVTNDPELECKDVTVPIVLMHGLCSYGNFLFLDKRVILEHVKPKPYIKVIHTACNFLGEMAYSATVNLRKQVDVICEMIKTDKKLEYGYNIVGYSQGGVIMRGVIEMCDGPPVFNFITLGSPHQGVYGFPLEKLFGVNKKFRKRKSLNKMANTKWMQKHSSVVGHWHNPFDEQEYKKFNVFLPDINNENELKAEYKERFSKLNLLVLVAFKKDNMVIPYQSAAFGYYKPGDEEGTMLNMKETELYKRDLIGLRTLDEQNKVILIEKDANHMMYSSKWFAKNIAVPFLGLKFKLSPSAFQPEESKSSEKSKKYVYVQLKELSESHDKFGCLDLEKSDQKSKSGKPRRSDSRRNLTDRFLHGLFSFCRKYF